MQGGTSAVNCSNYRGVFSFHANGACAAFGDGSVHVLGRENEPGSEWHCRKCNLFSVKGKAFP